MTIYLDLLEKILNEGIYKTDRTQIGCYSLFAHQLRFNLQAGFPIITTKEIHFKSIIHELLWFLKGSTNIEYLNKHNVRIWNEWADEQGELGPIYGYQWRSWPNQNSGPIDQIQNVIQEIKENPNSRRLVVSAWNVADIPKMVLPPCHILFQFYVHDNQLSCQLYQRSADVFLGVPFNISSYALLTHMIAQVCGLEVGHFVHTFGDIHLYKNHKEQALKQLKRKPYPLPTLKLNPKIKHILDFNFEDIQLANYQHHEKIKGIVAV